MLLSNNAVMKSLKSNLHNIITCFAIILISCTKENNQINSTIEVNLDKVKMLSLINAVRSTGCKCGSTNMPKVNPLAWNDTLAVAALNHSTDMNVKGYFSHTNKENLDPGDRLRNLKFPWRTYGENIALGQINEEDVMQAWLNSPGHCQNIMEESFKLVGVARVNNYWTQVFASK